MREVSDPELVHFEKLLRFDKPRLDVELRLLFDALPSLLAEVRRRRDKDAGILTTATELLMSGKYKQEVAEAKARAKATSDMLAALEKACTCGSLACLTKEERAAAIASARAAGIEPTK